MNEEIRKLKRAVIKEEFVAITGNFIDAVILNQFIYWSERVKDFDEYIKQENDRAKKCGQNPQDLTGGWIYKTADDLSSETMLGLSASNMRLHIKALEKAGFISERTNPKYKWDRTKQYRVNLNEIVVALTEMGYTLDGYQHYHIENATHDLKNQKTDLDTQSTDIDAQTSQTKTAIPETTPETTAETTPIKKERKTSFDDAISEYTSNDELKGTIIEFIKMRKLIKAPMTDRALKGIFNELDKLGHNDKEKIAILEQSIVRSWRGVFAISKPKQEPKQEEKHEMTIEEWAGDKLLPV
jgi:DNA-binding transcriptional ArsR family regulator